MMSSNRKPISLPQCPHSEAVAAPAARGTPGKGGYWRSLAELGGDPALLESAAREFAPGASEWSSGLSRRSFLRVMGASMALAGAGGCLYKKPQGQIVPATRSPEESVQGVPLFFATAMPMDGFGRGVLVESNQGRPTKIEGNPDHPASLGAADIFMQASVLELYDPDRSRTVMHYGRDDTWGTLYTQLKDRLDGQRSVGGAGLRILTGPQTSPTFAAQLAELRQQFPQMKWHVHDPLAGLDFAEGGGAFDQPARAIYDFSKAKVIVSLGAEFLVGHPAANACARQFIDGRRVRENSKQMNRLYVAESDLTLTGSMADHRLALRPHQVDTIAFELASRRHLPTAGVGALPAPARQWVNAVLDDLAGAEPGTTLVLAGPSQPPQVHALVQQLNAALGNLGKTVWHIDPSQLADAAPLAQLVADMQSGQVDTLLIFGCNPVYDTPADIAFADALKQMSSAGGSTPSHFTLRLGSHYDETAFLCQWHVPESHYLESWGDIRAFDGTASIIQPLIAPLYSSKSMWEVMETLLGRPDRGGFEIVRDYWQKHCGSADFERWWLQTLQDGVVAGSAWPRRPAPPIRATATGPFPTGDRAGQFDVLFRPDPCAWDGRFANNGWLQELPKPLTKLTWDNAAAISVATAEKLRSADDPLLDGDVIRVNVSGRSVEAPVIVVPGQADDTIVLHLGYGRWQGGSLLTEDDRPRGYNAYAVRSANQSWIDAASVTVTDRHHLLVVTRNHHAMSIEPGAPGVHERDKDDTAAIADPAMSDDDLALHNRRIVRTATLDQYRNDDTFMHKLMGAENKNVISLYPDWDYHHGLQWGMVIDQTACIGCNACIIGCQSENNIPVVGKEQVSNQREMHWIRIDSYFGGSVENPSVFHQPVPCMHCEDAPCEVVCPVGATTHSDEGLNEMTYNRCIGTRYCSNNCPYKVRRFNFLLFADYRASRDLQYNPDVTVRTRGVMEKCSYCVQRINETRVAGEERQVQLEAAAERASDPAERERLTQQAATAMATAVAGLQTACQQACPTNAIIFGNIRNQQSDVATLKREPTNYDLLGELTTKPRTSYLARITNPNPSLPPPDHAEGDA